MWLRGETREAWRGSAPAVCRASSLLRGCTQLLCLAATARLASVWSTQSLLAWPEPFSFSSSQNKQRLALISRMILQKEQGETPIIFMPARSPHSRLLRPDFRFQETLRKQQRPPVHHPEITTKTHDHPGDESVLLDTLYSLGVNCGLWVSSCGAGDFHTLNSCPAQPLCSELHIIPRNDP